MTGELQNSKEKMTLLYDLLRDATRRANLKGVFHVLFRGGKEGVGAKEGLVAQFNPEMGTLEVKTKTPGKLRDQDDLFSSNRGAVEKLRSIREPTIRSNEEDMFYKDSVCQLVATFAIDARGEPGLLILESQDANRFGPLELEFLKEMLEQTAPVIKTKSTVESSSQELANLWDVKRRVLSPDELDVSELNTLLNKVLQLALARTKSTSGAILMADEKSGELVTNSQGVLGDLTGNLPERLRRRETGRPSGIVYWVLDNNRPYISGNIENDPNYIPVFHGIKSHLSVPISFQDRCIGVIVVESPELNAYTQEEQETLEDLSKNVTILVRRAQLYEATRDASPGGRGVMIRGLSSEWEEVEKRIERAAATSATVIIRGESGTGKELVAHAIHFNSKRRDRKLVVVNSAAIPDPLLESTLFGHVKGAFTGASYERVGEFVKADQGSIFLDEIGELGLQLQVKLLRVLQSGEVHKVGSNEDPQHVDVRVIAATNRNLEDMMKRGQFREDLYYRLNVVPIWLPPLRQYAKSIPGMVKAFVQEAAREHGRPVGGISNDALELLMRHDYPGNVRELRNIIEQSVIMARGETVMADDLPRGLVAMLRGQTPKSIKRDFKSRKKEVLDNFEREYLNELLSEVRGNISRASEISGINRVNFYKLVRRHNLDPSGFR